MEPDPYHCSSPCSLVRHCSRFHVLFAILDPYFQLAQRWGWDSDGWKDAHEITIKGKEKAFGKEKGAIFFPGLQFLKLIQKEIYIVGVEKMGFSLKWALKIVQELSPQWEGEGWGWRRKQIRSPGWNVCHHPNVLLGVQLVTVKTVLD